jgi:peptide/nickel transport system substrate-binding protein
MGPANPKRDDVLRQANAMVYEEAPFWFFNYNKAVMAYQPWLKGLQRNANELAWQNYEDLWVDASSPAAK